MENKKEIILAIATLILLIVAVGGYTLWQRSNDSGAQRFVVVDQSNSTRPGPVAVLGQQPVVNNVPAPSNVQGESTQRPATESTQSPDISAQDEAKESYSLKLPSGWDKSGSKTTADPCSEGLEKQTDTYKKGSQTLIVYVNGHPDGCKRTSIADVYLDYDYTEANTGIAVKTSKIEQCSKDDNPACPKGDGLLSVYIGNESSENPDELRKNSQKNNTYFFSLVDTSIGANFEQQVKALAGIVDKISF